MGEWRKVRLEEIGTIVAGGTPSTKIKEYWNGDIPWITPKDLADFDERYISNGQRNITSKGLEKSSAKLLPKGTVLFSSRAPIGYIAIASNDVTTNQGFKSVIPNSKVDSLFLYYLLKYNKNKIENMGSGSTFKEVSSTVMKSIEVEIPIDIDEQKKIADILGKIDEKIELNKKINHHLEEIAFTLFENEFPNITVGEKRIGDYIVPKRGKSLLSKNAIFGNIPVVAGGINPATFHNVANTKAPVLTISASGANAGYINLWHCDVWSSDSSFIDSSMSNSVYFWFILLKKRQKEIFDMQTGSAQPHIYPHHISDMPIMELNIKNISSFNSKVTNLFSYINKNIIEIKRLESLRDTLLPKLISGEISVSELSEVAE